MDRMVPRDSCVGSRSSSTASVPASVFVQAMKTIHKGAAMTHTLLSNLVDRVDDMQGQLCITGHQSNEPLDPAARSRLRQKHQAEVLKFLPMRDDTMLHAFEERLVESHIEACDLEIKDKVRFFFLLWFVSRSCELVRVQL
jgi:hypothetical protein